MSLSAEYLRRESAKTGFRPEILEKVIRLLDLLEAIRRHPYLKSRVVLKGGTALNLFIFDVPRLSVDIDLNFIGTQGRDAMLAERKPFEQALQAVAGRLGLKLERAPTAHAGGKWLLRYESALGQGGTLELDVNYMFRVPLWPVESRDSREVGNRQARGIPIVDVHELAGGKLAALFSRRAGRDLFDAHYLLTRQNLDVKKLRLAFVLYGAMNRRDWRTVSVEDVGADPDEIRAQLAPVVSRQVLAPYRSTADWVNGLVDECREALSSVLPLLETEQEFLERLLDHGEIRPDLLDVDEAMNERIRGHPSLLWKARNAPDSVESRGSH